MNTRTYGLETLRRAVLEYFEAEEEFRLFLKTWKPGWWEDKTARELMDYTKYLERSQGTSNTVNMMCKMVKIDYNALILIVKSISRWEKHNGKYDRCIWSLEDLNWRTDNSFREAITEHLENCYYKSTGRKIAA